MSLPLLPKTSLLVILLLVLAAFNFFFLLDGERIHDWDEARQGVSAYEMVATGNYIVNTYNFETDYWNVKPPLSLWATAFAYKLFGPNVFALRFFSAVCSCITLLMVLLFCGRNLSWGAAFIAGGTFITLSSFVFEHNVRSGDPDAMFIMFSTGAILCAVSSGNKKWLVYVSALCLSFAFLAKSFHVLSPMLTALILLIWNHGKMLLNMKLLLGLLLAGFVPVLVWAALRYSYDGMQFFQIMIGYDVLERSFSTVEGHHGSMFFYLKVLHDDLRRYYALIIPLLLLLLFMVFHRNRYHRSGEAGIFNNRRLLFQLLLCVAVPFVLYSCAASKRIWYVYPAFPFIAILIGYLLYSIIRFLQTTIPAKGLIVGVCVFVFAYFFVLEALYVNKLIRNTRQVDPVQRTLLANGSALAAASHIYLEDGEWHQRLVLAAKLSAGLLPKDGGRTAWEQDMSKNAVLLTHDLKLYAKNGEILGEKQ